MDEGYLFQRSIAYCGLAAIAGTAGLGGGSLYSSVNLLFNDGVIRDAIPQAKPVVLGCAIGGILCHNWNKEKALASSEKPAIQYHMIAVMEPATLLGALLGVATNLYLSDIFIMFLFLAACVLVLWRIFTIAYQLSKPNSYRTISMDHYVEMEGGLDSKDHRHLWKRTTLMLMTTTTVTIVLLYTGDGPDGTSAGSWSSVMAVLWLCFVTAMNSGHYYSSVRSKQCGYSMEQGSTSEAIKTVTMLLVGGVSAGFLAGCIGIGGGMLKVPLMLHLGVSPPSAVVTSLYMVLFTATVTTSLFYLCGRLENADLLLPMLSGVLGTAIGTNYLRTVSRNHDGLLLWVIVVAMSLSFMSVLYIKFASISTIVGSWEPMLEHLRLYLL